LAKEGRKISIRLYNRQSIFFDQNKGVLSKMSSKDNNDLEQKDNTEGPKPRPENKQITLKKRRKRK
jgi:hypothetical protein